MMSERNTVHKHRAKWRCIFLACPANWCNDDLAVYPPKLSRAFYRIDAAVKVDSFQSKATDIGKVTSCNVPTYNGCFWGK